MIKKLLIIIFSFLLFSCASLPKPNLENQLQLTEENICKINGTYDNFAVNGEELVHLSVWGKLTGDRYKDSFPQVNIDVLNKEEIRFSFLKDQKEVHSKVIKYEIRDNGFLFLKNRNFRLNGIPFIFGSYDIRKYEIGLTKKGNLIINGVEEHDGAHLIILWDPSISYKFTHFYQAE